jgi:hypothetical protein
VEYSGQIINDDKTSDSHWLCLSFKAMSNEGKKKTIFNIELFFVFGLVLKSSYVGPTAKCTFSRRYKWCGGQINFFYNFP